MEELLADGRVVIRQVEVEEIVDLRHRILRAGLPPETALLTGDGAPTTIHLAAFVADRLAACLTVHLNTCEGEPAWQLRGMAVEDGYRGIGLGSRLLRHLDEFLVTRPGPRRLWCNARVPARRFYERNGWRSTSEPFEIPTAGPHVRMVREL